MFQYVKLARSRCVRTLLPRPTLKCLVAFTLVTAWGSASVQAQSPQAQRVRGIVERLESNTLVVKSREGETVPIRLTDTWGASGIVKASLADIKQGTYIGTAAMPASAGPTGLVVETGGKVWLFTLGPAGNASSGGTKVAEIGPLAKV